MGPAVPRQWQSPALVKMRIVAIEYAGRDGLAAALWAAVGAALRAAVTAVAGLGTDIPAEPVTWLFTGAPESGYESSVDATCARVVPGNVFARGCPGRRVLAAAAATLRPGPISR